MQQINHIVYIMMENRSFDHTLGWLYSGADQPKVFLPANTTPKVFNGLQSSFYNPDTNGNKVLVQQIPDFTTNPMPTEDPNEPYLNVNNQLFGSTQNPPVNQKPGMMGFVKDFSTVNTSLQDDIMNCFGPNSLPVLNYLAGMFAVSDAYYSSIPTQTNCNRAFAATGNSIGLLNGVNTAMTDNHWGPQDGHEWDPYEFNGPTIWNVLNDNGFYTPADWSIFYSQAWPGHGWGDYCFTQDLFWPSLQNDGDHFLDISSFFTQVQQGALPTFSFIEPAWYEDLWNGNDYHPPCNLVPGERFLLDIYLAIKNSPSWEDTLLIINFDEHGGTYDHQAPAWRASPPWQNPNQGTAAPQALEHNFGFNRFGVRVPLILVSPYIQQGTLFRSNTAVPMDHTSIIATVLNQFGIPKSNWGLGSRVYNAPTFEFVLQMDQLRYNIPVISLPEVQPTLLGEETAPNDLQWMVAHKALARRAKTLNIPAEKMKQLYTTHFQNIKTMKDLNIALTKISNLTQIIQ